MRVHRSPEELIVVVNGYDMYSYMKLRGVKNIAVSYWTRPRPPFKPEDQWMHSVHFLGLLTLEELKEFDPPSIDTSMPIKLAMIGQTMEQWVETGCVHINTKDLGKYGASFFNSQLDESTLKLALENIDWLKEQVC